MFLCATLKSLAPLADRSAFDAETLSHWWIAPRLTHRSLLPRRVVPLRLLRLYQSLPGCLTPGDGLRIAPYADTSTPLCRSWFGPSCNGLRRGPHFKLRTDHELLRARRLAFAADLGLLRSCILRPCVARGSLREQHLRVLHRRHLAMRSTLITPPRDLIALLLDCSNTRSSQSRHLTLRSFRGLLRALHLVPGVSYGLLRRFHLCSVLGPCGLP